VLSVWVVVLLAKVPRQTSAHVVTLLHDWITSQLPPRGAYFIPIHHYMTGYSLGRCRRHKITELVQSDFFLKRSYSGCLLKHTRWVQISAQQSP